MTFVHRCRSEWAEGRFGALWLDTKPKNDNRDNYSLFNLTFLKYML